MNCYNKLWVNIHAGAVKIITNEALVRSVGTRVLSKRIVNEVFVSY
jgi:hypothetical protein